MDHRADIYSLGVVFYQMLTGELPKSRLEPPSRKVQIDVRLDEIVLRALEREPERRYQQASVLKTQVETIAQEPESFEPARKPRARFRSMAEAVEGAFGFTFTSKSARLVANLSALGFIGFLSYLAGIPSLKAISPLAGFFGFFGLIGVAYLMELIHRRGNRGSPPSLRQSSQERSRLPPQACFSRLAIVGAAWIPWVFIFLLGMFWQTCIVVAPGTPPPGPSPLQIIGLIITGGLGLTSPFGATICGIVAISKSAGRAGRLYGVALAVADALFFPLLILNGVIGLVVGTIDRNWAW